MRQPGPRELSSRTEITRPLKRQDPGCCLQVCRSFHDTMIFRCSGGGKTRVWTWLESERCPCLAGSQREWPAYSPGLGSLVSAWLSLPSTASAPPFPPGSPAPSLSLPPGVAKAQLQVAPLLIASESWKRKANESVCDSGLGRWGLSPQAHPGAWQAL